MICFYVVTKINEWFLEQQINTTFCVNSEKNAQDICAMLSKAYVGEVMKKPSVFE
jgi:hypothetical protein